MSFRFGLPKMFHAFLLILLIAGTQSYSSHELLQRLYGVYNQIKEYPTRYNYENIIPRFTFKTSDWGVDPSDDHYDFIIVGSGSAGAALANRLSEINEWKILLLEAGKPESILSVLPAMVPYVQFTKYNWDYLMEYQANFAKGMVGRRLGWPRGRALGGTSVINYMIYSRGNPRDFNRWAADGNPGWSYADVLPYFLKSEGAKLAYMNPNFHNTTGPWAVEDVNRTPLTEAFIAGGNELGYPRVDYTSDMQIGFGTAQGNVRSGRRDSVAKAFLEPIRNRKNLHIYTSARVTKVLINNSKAAYGVEYVWRGRKMRAVASKEVVLSAGAFASPQLLMLSGIGPRKDLEKLKIKVIEDLPVGQSLQDHITYVGLNFLINQDVGISLLRGLNPLNIYRWFSKGDGMLTSLGGVSGIGYIKTTADEDPDMTYPDMELLFVDATLGSDFYATAKGMKIRRGAYKQYWGPIQLTPKWTIFPMLVHPKSVGYLKLKSSNPFEPPAFFGNYFSDPEGHDLRTMIAAIRFIQNLAKTKGFQRFESQLYNATVPGCENYKFDSDAYWKCALETFCITLHHQVGTCKMGPADSPTSVVDPELRVKGIKNLRVADTSVIPFAITAHTSAPSVMVGEKAADIIKRSWGK